MFDKVNLEYNTKDYADFSLTKEIEGYDLTDYRIVYFYEYTMANPNGLLNILDDLGFSLRPIVSNERYILKTETMVGELMYNLTPKEGMSSNTFRMYLNLYVLKTEYKRIYDIFKKFIDDNLPKKETFADWYYKSGNSISYSKLPVKKFTGIVPENYPFIDDIDGYLESYMSSPAPIIILNGDPGTGKTTLIRYMLHKFGINVATTYDPDIMKMDVLYQSLLREDGYDAIILEDADILLADRIDSGNSVMSKMLNISDGLFDVSTKKIIITSNLKNQSDVDAAFLRPGRCYGLIEFRKLTIEESMRAAKANGFDFEPYRNKEYSLAEIFRGSNKSAHENVIPLKSGMGFNAR